MASENVLERAIEREVARGWTVEFRSETSARLSNGTQQLTLEFDGDAVRYVRTGTDANVPSPSPTIRTQQPPLQFEQSQQRPPPIPVRVVPPEKSYFELGFFRTQHPGRWLFGIVVFVVIIIVASTGDCGSSGSSSSSSYSSSSSSSSSSRIKLHVPSSNCSKSSISHYQASGEVVNKSDRTLDFVRVHITWRGTSGNMLATDWTYIHFSEGFSPGSTSTWREITSFNDSDMPKVASCSITFEVDGKLITPTFGSKTSFSK